ncbi:zinc-dependent metalloprotease [Luteimicrobium subarcticum]|uniref:Putative hydrolase/coenzyme F420 biosynthesis associated uncharacterized protein n=1 Tax=Luteimicrobium subarcticum TaxID=620910 RepID=A0A2M8WSK8_9MICO|nr:zinc-dependent metalloprotease [Luteimicrobium subarcticum]PJI93937.1 putative hydrolase/coenzyme F420 biosynthesis associated uncharacterized protein [Luteimicrobium subarcticum]
MTATTDVEIVDWSAAASLAGRVAPPGPVAPRAELEALVGSLRSAARRAVAPVQDVTGLVPATPGDASVLVVDRARWARANTEIMATVAQGALEAVLGDRPAPPGPTALVGAAQVGSVLALLSSRVLGQFDPYTDPGGAGRLLLVAPNLLAAEQRLGVDPEDFRLWVCLHEQTHALQFAAAPWLGEHLASVTRDLLADLAHDTRELGESRFRDKLRALVSALSAAVRGDGQALLAGIVSDEDRARLADVTAVMALLEGHADVAMDDVGPALVPSVRDIRARFEARRDGAGRADVVVRRLLGVEAKIAQYRDGAAFVRAVTDRVGQDGLNAAFSGPTALPTAAEIADPRAWVRRVHG